MELTGQLTVKEVKKKWATGQMGRIIGYIQWARSIAIVFDADVHQQLFKQQRQRETEKTVLSNGGVGRTDKQ